jgi:hypothetical protein
VLRDLVMLLFISRTSHAAVTLPNWPNAVVYWGALVNANVAITTYLQENPSWFTNVKLATDVESTGVNDSDPIAAHAAQSSFNAAQQALTANGILGGDYISGSLVEPLADVQQYPFGRVAQQYMPSIAKYCGVWSSSEPYAQFVCFSDAPTMAAFHAIILRDWQQTHTRIHFVDNAGSLEGGYGDQSWAGQVQNMQVINQMAQSIGTRAIFNISMIPGEVSAADMNLLVNALRGAGLALEEPWPAEVSSSPSLTAVAVQQYRQLLDAGIAVVMIQIDSSGEATSQQLKSWVRTWRKPGDRLYLSQCFFEQPDPSIYFLKQ